MRIVDLVSVSSAAFTANWVGLHWNPGPSKKSVFGMDADPTIVGHGQPRGSGGGTPFLFGHAFKICCFNL